MGQETLKQLAERLLTNQKTGTTLGQERDTDCPTAHDSNTASGTPVLAHLRSLPPDELARLDLRFRIVAPDDADAWSLADWLEWIAERSAILEFDSGYSLEQADQEAALMWRLYRGHG